MSFSDLQEQERATWQYRCVQATRGNQTQMGAILIAAMGHDLRISRPKLVGQAVIVREGWILCDFVDCAGTFHKKAAVCMVSDLTAMFSRLADNLRLLDRDRIELFQTLRNWVARDLRIDQTLHFTKTQ